MLALSFFLHTCIFVVAYDSVQPVCVFFSSSAHSYGLSINSVDAYPTQRRKMEKGSKLLLSLKRKEKPQLQPQTSSNAHSEVINMIRVQMQASYKINIYFNVTS